MGGFIGKLQGEEEPMDAEGCLVFQGKLRMSEEAIDMANHALYIDLIAFTTGVPQVRITVNSVKLAFESYRCLYQRGKNATSANIVQI